MREAIELLFAGLFQLLVITCLTESKYNSKLKVEDINLPDMDKHDAFSSLAFVCLCVDTRSDSMIIKDVPNLKMHCKKSW